MLCDADLPQRLVLASETVKRTLKRIRLGSAGPLAQLDIEALRYVGNALHGLVDYELLEPGQTRLLSLTTFGTTAELHSRLLHGTSHYPSARREGSRRPHREDRYTGSRCWSAVAGDVPQRHERRAAAHRPARRRF